MASSSCWVRATPPLPLPPVRVLPTGEEGIGRACTGWDLQLCHTVVCALRATLDYSRSHVHREHSSGVKFSSSMLVRSVGGRIEVVNCEGTLENFLNPRDAPGMVGSKRIASVLRVSSTEHVFMPSVGQMLRVNPWLYRSSFSYFVISGIMTVLLKDDMLSVVTSFS